jgi:AraC-like DNA-binding protein
MSETGFRRLALNTRDLPERDRPAFCEAIGRSLLGVEVDPHPGAALDAAMTLLQLPGLVVAAGHLSPMRSRHLPHLADNDDLVLAVPQRGGLKRIEQRGRETVISGDVAALATNGEPRLSTWETPTRVLDFRLSRKLLAPLVADFDAALVRPIPTETEALRLLIRYADDVLNGKHAFASPALCQTVSAHLHDLAALALGATRDAAAEAARNGGLRAARRVEILRKIERDLHDPGLTAAALAAQLGLSRRYVSLLLEETGQTFSEYVLVKRLDCAAQQLRDPRHDHARISDIAFAAGFIDLSHFNRSFRRRFGVTPSDLRATARCGRN